MIGNAVVAVLIGLLILMTNESLARSYKRRRETDDAKLARRQREQQAKVLEKVNRNYDETHAWWWN